MQSFNSGETVLRAVVYIEDALAYKSLCHRIDPLSIQLYRFLQTSLYKVIYGTVVGLILLLAFIEHPSSLSNSSDFTINNGTKESRYELPFGVTHSIEFICILLFAVDFLAKCRISDKSPWKSNWLLAYGIVTALNFIFFWVFVGTRLDQFRVYRILRPFYLIQNNSIMKKMLNAIKKSLPEVLGVLVVLALNIVVFGLSGHILFSDATETTDVSNEYFKTINQSMWSLLVLITTANNPDVMIPAYRINRAFVLYFIVFIWLGTYGLINLLLAVIYNQFRQHFKVSVRDMVRRRAIALRAAFEVLTNPVQTPDRSYSQSVQDSFGIQAGHWGNGGDDEDQLVVEEDNFYQERDATKPEQSFIEISTLNSMVDLIRMDGRYKRFLYTQLEDTSRIQTDYLDKQDFVKFFIEIEAEYSEWEKRQQALARRRRTQAGIARLRVIVTRPIFELVGTVLALVNTIALLVTLSNKPDRDTGIHAGAELVLVMNIFITFYFIIEQILRMLGVGLRAYCTTFSYCFDMVLTLALSILMLVLYTRDEDASTSKDEVATNLMRCINLCICFRICRVVLQVKRLRTVVQTYLTLIKQMQVYLGILIGLMYVFAIIGMELFSEDVTKEIHNVSAVKNNKTLANQCGTYWNLEYYSLNFDDFFASIITLFTLMVVNNWHVIVEAFTYSRNEWWSYPYFITWWVVCVLLVLNVIIALILDAFIDRWDSKDSASASRGNFHINQFLAASERAQEVPENEVMSALHKNNVIKNPFVNINTDNTDLPSASHVIQQRIFCAK